MELMFPRHNRKIDGTGLLSSTRLSVKVILAMSASVLLIAVLFVILVERGNIKKLEKQLVEQQTLITEGQSIILSEQMYENDDEAIFLTLTGVIANPVIVGVNIEFFDDREAFSIGEQRDGMDVSFPVSYFDEVSGDLLDIGSITSYRTDKYLKSQARDRYRFQAMLIAGILAALTAAVGMTIHVYVGRPLSRIMQALECADADSAPKIDWQSNDEMGVVVSHLNYLHERQNRHMDGLKEKLNQSERREFERLGSLANASQEAIVIVQYGKVVDCNARMHELTGLDRDSIDHNFLKQCLALDIKELTDQLEEKTIQLQQDGLLRSLCGRKTPVEVHLREIQYGSDTALVIVVRDISERFEAEAAIRHMALHDSLTDLANRNMFMDELDCAIEHCCATSTRFAVMYIDLDNFKTVNDTFGHAVGDNLLTEVANILNQFKRSQDVAARLGGDEFAMLICEDSRHRDCAVETKPKALLEHSTEAENLPFVSQAFEPQTIGKKIAHEISKLRQSHSITARIGASIGYSVFDGSENTNHVDRDGLLAQADLALYHIKESGKNGVARYTPEISKAGNHAQQLAASLPDALQNNELSLAFQPQVDAQSRELVGFEALLRWHSTELGNIPPESILQAAEQAGVSAELTSWIISTACRNLASWPDKLRMAINLSANELTQDRLIEHLTDEISKHNILASQLEIEVTETALISDELLTRQVIDRLSNQGISIALDDFGTGYSSLSMLLQYPIDRIKIDKSFVTKMKKESNEALIASTMIELAHGLGFSVIAEGAEVEADVERLAGQSCDEIQGYFIGKPMPSESIYDFITEYSIFNRSWQNASIRQDQSNLYKTG